MNGRREARSGEGREGIPGSSSRSRFFPSFHVLAKPTGPLCNLDCQYCFYLEKKQLYPGTDNWAMPEDVLESFVRQYIESQESSLIHFSWQGGEPTLLGVDFFRHVVELQRKYRNGKSIENGFQTNGVLLDDEWCEFLAENRFLVGLSLDGPREVHDRYRMDRGGRPSFDRVMRGLGFLRKHSVEFNTLTVVPRESSLQPLPIYLFLKEIGSRFLQFIPIVERVAAEPDADGLVLISPDSEEPARVTGWSVRPKEYGKFLCSIFDEWVRRDVGQCFVQLFDVALESWCGREPSLCVFKETCGMAMAIEHNGDLYSCDHYVYPRNRLGNILKVPLAGLVDSPFQQDFGMEKRDTLPRYCQKCDVRFACNGECPKRRFTRTPDGEEGLNYLCAGYKLFFNHARPSMDFMVEMLRSQRPPALVMQWARQRDLLEAGKRRPGRNDPCPCGSGRKFKRCCGS